MAQRDYELPWAYDARPTLTERAKEASPHAIRGGSAVLPAAIRLASGFGSGTGHLLGAGVSGAGEIIAQLIEDGKINWPRVGVEAGIGAIPGGKLVKVGSALKSGGIGALLGASGAALRDLTPAEGEERKLSLGNIATGATVGGAAGAAVGKISDYFLSKKNGLRLGKGERKATYKATDKPHGPQKMDDQFRTDVRRTPEDIEQLAQRAEVRGDVAAARQIREAAVKAGKDDTAIRNALLREDKVPVTEKVAIRQHRAADEILSDVDKAAQAEAKWIESYKKELERLQKEKNAGAAANVDVMEARARKVADDAAAAEVERLKAGLEPQPPVVKESHTAATATGGRETATVTHRVPAEEGGGSSSSRPASPRPTSLESKGIRVMDRERAAVVLGYDPEEAVRRGVVIKDGDGYRLNTEIFKKTRARTEAGGRVPEKPVGPKPGVFQIVTPEGKVSDVTDEASAYELLNLLGPKAKIILPSDYVPTKPPKPPDEPPAAAAAPIAPKPPAPPAPAAAQPAAPPRTAPGPLSAQARLAELGYTPDDIQKLTAKEADAIIKAGTKKEAFAPLTPKAPKGPAAPIADVSEVLAEGPFARFFPNQKEALKAGALVEEQPEDLIGKIWQLFGKADTTKRLAKAEGKEDASGSLWQMISKLSKEHNLPSLPRGASAKPNFKNVPPAERGMKPTLSTKPLPGQQSLGAPPAAPQFREPISSPVWMGDPADPQKHQKILDNLLNQKNRIINSNIIYEVAPDDIKIRMQAAGNKLEILNNAGKVPSKEADQVSQELQKLSEAAFERQYPHLVSEIAETEKRVADAAAKAQAVPKGLEGNGRKGPETGEVEIGGLLKGALPLAGAAVGGAMYQDDPLMGALIGAGLGYGGAKGIEAFSRSGLPFMHIGSEDPKDSLLRLLSGFQRFNYLSDPWGLFINTALAPPGAGVMGGIERMAVGQAEQLTGASPLAANKVQEGADSLRELLSSRGVFGKDNWRDAWDRAQGLIGTAERAEELPDEAIDMLRQVFTRPGQIMTMGDVVVRDALMKAGIPENIARAITVTSNPRYDLGDRIVNFAKKPVGTLMLPFSRTAANVVEGGLERTPFVGFMLDKTNDPTIKATFTEMVTRQGLGMGMWYLGYLAGKTVNPDLNEKLAIRKIVTNMSGQYGLPVAAGFAAGQAVQLGQIDDNFPNYIAEAIKSYGRDLPLPSTQNLQDVWNTVPALLNREPLHPNAELTSRKYFPYAVMPGVIPAVEEMIRNPEETTALPWEY